MSEFVFFISGETGRRLFVEIFLRLKRLKREEHDRPCEVSTH